jgi:hypothetical protein
VGRLLGRRGIVTETTTTILPPPVIDYVYSADAAHWLQQPSMLDRCLVRGEVLLRESERQILDHYGLRQGASEHQIVTDPPAIYDSAWIAHKLTQSGIPRRRRR